MTIGGSHGNRTTLPYHVYTCKVINGHMYMYMFVTYYATFVFRFVYVRLREERERSSHKRVSCINITYSR